QSFLAAYANSDLAATAQRLIERARSRALVASLGPVTPTCACTPGAPPAREKKAKGTKKEKQASRTTEKSSKRSRRGKDFISDEEIGQGPGPRPVGGGPVVGPPVSIGIGLGGRGPTRPGGGGMPAGGGTHPATVPGRPAGGQRY